MKIGIDITPIQGPHRMRGVGSVIINVVNNIPKESAKNHQFVIYTYPEHTSHELVLDLLDLSNINYEIRYVAHPVSKKRARRLRKYLQTLKSMIFSDGRYYDTKDLDVFLQLDQNMPLPRTRATKFLMIYDLIPLALELDYLRGYRASRNTGYSFKASIKNMVRRSQYKLTLKSNCRQADKLLSISNHTKNDFVEHLGVDPDKITVIPLGAPDVPKADSNMKFKPYRDTSWGAFRGNSQELDKQGYILYIGGIDPRRKMHDLFAAYNNLRARGENIKLVLAGDILTSTHNITDQLVRDYVTEYSYTDDILFLGFIGEDEKSWLYENAVAVVYPSVYEGFGLPVLEAMKHGTPVICYNNSSVPEVGGDAALYAKNHQEIVDHIVHLRDSPAWRSKVSKAGLAQSEMFSWRLTSKRLLSIISAD